MNKPKLKLISELAAAAMAFGSLPMDFTGLPRGLANLIALPEIATWLLDNIQNTGGG